MERSPLADTEVHALRSVHVDDELQIFVGRCGIEGTEPAATLYLTDANGYFGLAVDVIRLMQIAAHLPPILVVGIGYPVGGVDETIAQRTRDLTPSPDRAYAEVLGEDVEMGGAGALLQFVRDELFPWVGAHYAVLPGERTFFGHSLGGLFGTYVLLTQPDTFQRYAIGSPSLWWDGNVALSLEQAYADAHDDLAATVYFGIGADETYDGRKREAANYPDDLRAIATAWPFDMVEDLHRLVGQLGGRRYPGLQLTSTVFPDEFHVTVAPLILSRALRQLFHAPR